MVLALASFVGTPEKIECDEGALIVGESSDDLFDSERQTLLTQAECNMQ